MKSLEPWFAAYIASFIGLTSLANTILKPDCSSAVLTRPIPAKNSATRNCECHICDSLYRGAMTVPDPLPSPTLIKDGGQRILDRGFAVPYF